MCVCLLGLVEGVAPEHSELIIILLFYAHKATIFTLELGRGIYAFIFLYILECAELGITVLYMEALCGQYPLHFVCVLNCIFLWHSIGAMFCIFQIQ